MIGSSSAVPRTPSAPLGVQTPSPLVSLMSDTLTPEIGVSSGDADLSPSAASAELSSSSHTLSPMLPRIGAASSSSKPKSTLRRTSPGPMITGAVDLLSLLPAVTSVSPK